MRYVLVLLLLLPGCRGVKTARECANRARQCIQEEDAIVSTCTSQMDCAALLRAARVACDADLHRICGRAP